MKLEEIIRPLNGTEKDSIISCHRPWTTEKLRRFDAIVGPDTIKELGKYDNIKELAGITDDRKMAIGLSVFFGSDNAMQNLQAFLSYKVPEAAEDESEWSEYMPIGNILSNPSENITGHTILSEDEFSYLVNMATSVIQEYFPIEEADREDI